EILLTEVDLREIEETRKVWPFFRDRRVCSYDDLTMKLGIAYQLDDYGKNIGNEKIKRIKLTSQLYF
ncbi:MAG: hypothetical protein DSY59_03120, partial [Persephonella sp.]